MVHNPGYDFNDDNLATGAAYWVLLAERFLAHPTRSRACFRAVAKTTPLEAP